ncbi:MAG: hypothetical protein KAS30_03590, partial [Candidatus Diapherotrites archaeon]|nr:hypothetical protein [Candidatus Diapherotrites archaeon]
MSIKKKERDFETHSQHNKKQVGSNNHKIKKDEIKHVIAEEKEEVIPPVKMGAAKDLFSVNSNVINVLLVLAVMLLIFNVVMIGTIKSVIATSPVDLQILNDNSSNLLEVTDAKIVSDKTSVENTFVSTGDPVQDAINAVIPTGSTGLYGEELGISFDDVNGGLAVLARLESTISYDNLTESQKERYVKIATTPYTACEFCCGIGPKGFGTT